MKEIKEISITKFILDHKYFNFADQFFLQTHSTAMGTRMAAVYANLILTFKIAAMKLSEKMEPCAFLDFTYPIENAKKKLN